MVELLLTRRQTSDQGTFGSLSVGGRSFYTGELPWRDNASDFSCIPVGKYEARVTFSGHFGRELYELFGVKGRFACRIHPANFMGDSKKGYHCQLNGCIALGDRFGVMEGQKSILLSRPAVDTFMSLMDKKPFTLEIRNVGT